MKQRLLSLLLAGLLVMQLLPVLGAGAASDDVSINATELTLYDLDSWAEDYLTIPEELPQVFQLVVTGAERVRYSVSGGSVTVSTDGLIQPKVTTWYWYGSIGYGSPISGREPDKITSSTQYGSSTVTVYADDARFTIPVTVTNYADLYANEKMDDYIAQTITPEMSDYDKLDALCRFVAGFDYDASHSGATPMIVCGGGDCWASAYTLVKMCEKIGIPCYVRNGNRDPGAGSGHMNALAVLADGLYYELEAGYYAKAPRPYTLKKRTSLFSYVSVSGGIRVYQLDGPSEGITALTVPDAIDGKTVVEIGDYFLSGWKNVQTIALPATVRSIGKSAFKNCSALTALEIPESCTSIGGFVFTACQNLTNLSVAEGNTAFRVCDGVLYNYDQTELLAAPCCAAAQIPDTVEQIGPYSFYYNDNLRQITIPASVTTIGEGAFGNCASLRAVHFAAGSQLNTLSDFSFYANPGLRSMRIPAGCQNFGRYSVGIVSTSQSAEQIAAGFVLLGNAGTPTQTYAEQNHVTFVDVSAGGWVDTRLGRFYCDGDTLAVGWHKVDGVCYFFDEVGLWQESVSRQELRNEKAADCTQDGYTGDIYCLGCGELLQSGTVIPAKGHSAVTDPGQPATCTEDGLTEGSHCSVCNQILVAQQTIEATGHTAVTDPTVPATCTEDGLTEGSHCSVCNQILVAQQTIEATGHTAVTDPGQPATCTEDGLTEGSHCSRCGDILTAQSKLAALGHAWDDGTVVRESTETKPGEILYACTRCGETKTEPLPVKALPFTDVREADWFYSAVAYAVEHNLFNGTGAATFSPNVAMNRAMLVTVLWRYEGEPEAATASFTDVPTGQWYTDAINWASENGIVSGTGNGKFTPKGKVSREQMATILFRYAEKKGVDVSKRGDLSQFTDGTKVSSWAKDAMQWAVAEGILNGSKGLLTPQNSATRAQVATVLMRYIENIVK